MLQLIITVFAKDRPGVVKQLSDVVLKHQGGWLESSLSRLKGQFAGIVHLQIEEKNRQALLDDLAKLKQQDILITPHSDAQIEDDNISDELVDLLVEANDRTGIVDEICSLMEQNKINILQMETDCESAPMAGYGIFRAHLTLALPKQYKTEQLEAAFESVSDDLIVTIYEN